MTRIVLPENLKETVLAKLQPEYANRWKGDWEARLQYTIEKFFDYRTGTFEKVATFKQFVRKLQTGACTAQDFHELEGMVFLLMAVILEYLQEEAVRKLLPLVLEAERTKEESAWWEDKEHTFLGVYDGCPIGYFSLLVLLRRHPCQEMLPFLLRLQQEFYHSFLFKEELAQAFQGSCNSEVEIYDSYGLEIIGFLNWVREEALKLAAQLPGKEANNVLIAALADEWLTTVAVELIGNRPKSKRLVFALLQVYCLNVYSDYDDDNSIKEAEEVLKAWGENPTRGAHVLLNYLLNRKFENLGGDTPDPSYVFAWLSRTDFSEKYYWYDRSYFWEQYKRWLGKEQEAGEYPNWLSAKEVVTDAISMIKNWLVHVDKLPLADLYYSRLIYTLNSWTNGKQKVRDYRARKKLEEKRQESSDKEEEKETEGELTIKEVMRAAIDQEPEKELRELLERINNYLR